MKKLLENKSYGFYVTFVSVVVSIVCAAVYASMYSGSRYMEWPAVVAMLVGGRSQSGADVHQEGRVGQRGHCRC